VRLGYWPFDFCPWLREVAAADGARETIKYNPSCDLVEVTVNDTQVIRRQYSPKDLLLSSAVLGEPERKFEYDAQGRRTARIDTRGGRATYDDPTPRPASILLQLEPVRTIAPNEKVGQTILKKV